MNITKEDIELLKRIKSYLPNHAGFEMTHAMYIPPAQQLRNQASRIEAQEIDEKAFDLFINSLDITK